VKKFWDNSAGPMLSADAGKSDLATRVVPTSLAIGNVTISPATVLAPMAGVTDTVFRRFIRNLGGCGLIMTEFTSADGVLRKKDQKAKRYLHFYEDEHPISAQLFGSNPQVMAEAAHMVEDLGFDLVDLNLGCPAKKVVKCNGGSGLLRDLPAIGKIFEAVRAAVKIPFTVKFRAGWNDEEIVCVELARMAESCGLAAVALHARTREQGYSGNARWEWIAAVKDAVRIPVIGNGDIRSPQDACAMVTQTGCDAVMIGRSAPSNPWIFRQIEQYCGALSRQGQEREGRDFSRAESGAAQMTASAAEGGFFAREPMPSGAKAQGSFPTYGTAEAVPFPSELRSASSEVKLYDQPSEADRYQMIRTYFQMLIEEELPDAVGKMKQFASWFTHGVPGGAHLRKEIYESKSAPEVLSRVESFFEARLAAPAATDSAEILVR
jgi:tRNA-dihydrouridine synthase B